MQKRNRTFSERPLNRRTTPKFLRVRVSIRKLISRTLSSHPPLVALFFRETQGFLQCGETAIEVLGYLVRVYTVPTVT